MKCPKCGKDMVLGEIFNSRGDSLFYWAPKTFFDKHWANAYCHRRKTIENEGGIMIKANRNWQKVSACYGCKECNMIVIDCD